MFIFHSLPSPDEYVDRQMQQGPAYDIDDNQQRHVHPPRQQDVQADEEHRDEQDRHHHHPHTHARAQQLVVEMVLVRQERVLALAQAVQHLARAEKFSLRGDAAVLTDPSEQALIRLLDRFSLWPEQVEITEEQEMILHYSGNIRIRLGTDDCLEEKITKLSGILPQLEGMSGELHLEDVDEQSGDVVFSRDIQESEDRSSARGTVTVEVLRSRHKNRKTPWKFEKSAKNPKKQLINFKINYIISICMIQRRLILHGKTLRFTEKGKQT